MKCFSKQLRHLRAVFLCPWKQGPALVLHPRPMHTPALPSTSKLKERKWLCEMSPQASPPCPELSTGWGLTSRAEATVSSGLPGSQPGTSPTQFHGALPRRCEGVGRPLQMPLSGVAGTTLASPGVPGRGQAGRASGQTGSRTSFPLNHGTRNGRGNMPGILGEAGAGLRRPVCPVPR